MANDRKPTVDVPQNQTPPSDLVIEDLTEGTGDEAVAGRSVEVHYVGVAWSNGKEFDASWNRGETFEFRLGAGQVIRGWDAGVAGMKVGGTRRLTIRPALGDGAAGAGGVIKGGETLVFVVDLVGLR
jgi:peptidylprolyl isomerase